MRLRAPAARRGERGSVTAELAAGLVPVAAALLLAGWLAGAGAAQVRVQLAAGAAARALARGEAPAVVTARTAQAAGPGARLEHGTHGGLVQVRVTAPLDVPLLGAVTEVSGRAVSPAELP